MIDRSKGYNTWHSMKQRCLNPKNTNWPKYGARGITVCTRWLSYRNFLEDMGHKPPGMTLDRIDGTLGYSKENCRWATDSQQTINTKTRVDNKLGLKNIDMVKGRYRISITRDKVTRQTFVQTLEEAVELRNHILEELSNDH